MSDRRRPTSLNIPSAFTPCRRRSSTMRPASRASIFAGFGILSPSVNQLSRAVNARPAHSTKICRAMITWILSWLAEPRGGEEPLSSDVTAHDAFARAAEADRQMRLLQEISVADRFNRDEALHWRRVA